MNFPHFNKNVLNNVKIKNIFNNKNMQNMNSINKLLTNYKEYPTIIRIIEKDRQNAVGGAYGRMAGNHGVPMNVIRRIQEMVSNKTPEKNIHQAMVYAAAARQRLHV
jgi:hypothetical protein